MNPLLTYVTRHPIAVGLLVIILGVVGATMISNQMSETEKQKAQQVEELKAKYEQKTKIVRAAKDIAEGGTISADDVVEEEVMVGNVPVGAISSSTMAIGRIAKYAIPANQPLTAHDFVTSGQTIGFESKIKEGQRAVTFGVDSTTGVSGFITPGSHVDVIATTGSQANTRTSAVLSDVEVIAVGQQYQKQPNGQATSASVVTVTLSPTDSNKLIKSLAAAGRLYLTLRNSKDHTPVPIVDVTSMFDNPASLAAVPPAPSMPAVNLPPPPPPTQEIEMWSGSKKEVISVPKS